MADAKPSSTDHLDHARELVWDALQMLEEAQRVLFKAGDCYVGQVWGDGVRAVILCTEHITELSGDLSAAHNEIGRLVARDKDRGRNA